MEVTDINTSGLVLLGCGKMGSAMLEGWLARGVMPGSVHVIDPKPSDWLRAQGVGLNGDLPNDPAVVLIAVKPQMMGDALPAIRGFGADTLFVSIAAGTSLASFQAVLGADRPIIRAMPNTPAAVGKGITAIVGNSAVTQAHLTMAEALLQAVGDVLRVKTEAQIDAVTGVSGSGPAYVFYMIECLAEAGVAQGLSADVAMRLAKATVAGAGHLAGVADETPDQLRVNVTSPGGTTQAGLEVLMDADTGLEPLILKTVKAATDRARDLGA